MTLIEIEDDEAATVKALLNRMTFTMDLATARIIDRFERKLSVPEPKPKT